MGGNLPDSDTTARGLGKGAGSVMMRQAQRIEDLEVVIRAALSFIQDRHPSHDDGHAVMVIVALRGALRTGKQ